MKVARRRVRPMLFASAILALSSAAFSANVISGARGLTISVDPAGSYGVQFQTPAWEFAGTVGAPLSNLAVTAGFDGIGSYSEIGFDFQTDAPRHGAIRAYQNRPAVLFTLTCPSGAPNSTAFPTFDRYPTRLSHIAYSGIFANYSFASLPPESPWLFFDSAANAFILSAASNFMVSQNSSGPHGEMMAGIAPSIAALPAGFSNQVLLVADTGINRTFDTWGSALTSLQGKTRPRNDADVSLARLNYWTDNGATYYYRPENAAFTAANSFTTNYEQTLSGMKTNLDALGIPLGALQLDSWFYPKGPNLDWSDSADGIYEYVAAPALFPTGLAAFQQTLGVPLITHARWLDASSPYRKTYQVSGNVATDPAYWNDIAQYLKRSGVGIYEQDWLGAQAQTAFNLADPPAFLDNMARAMAAQSINLQYCMATPRHFLQGSKYGNLTTIRVSGDRFESSKWSAFLYSSRLAGALGIWPFSDVFMSSETGNLILATLSAGPVGIGDRIGTVSSANLLHAVRKDGVIVKPDVPVTPLDSSFLHDGQAMNGPMIASTYSDSGATRTWYVFAYPQGSNQDVQFSPSSLGAAGPVYLYDYLGGAGALVQPADTVDMPLGGAFAYWIAAPVGASGMAILGDTGNYVSMGSKRIPSFTDNGQVHMTVAFAKGEAARTIQGYSPDAPKIWARNGAASPLAWDPATGRFHVTLSPGADGTAAVILRRETIAPPVRR